MGRVLFALLLVAVLSAVGGAGFSLGRTAQSATPTRSPSPTWTDRQLESVGGAIVLRCTYHFADGTTRIVDMTRGADCPATP